MGVFPFHTRPTFTSTRRTTSNVDKWFEQDVSPEGRTRLVHNIADVRQLWKAGQLEKVVSLSSAYLQPTTMETCATWNNDLIHVHLLTFPVMLAKNPCSSGTASMSSKTAGVVVNGHPRLIIDHIEAHIARGLIHYSISLTSSYISCNYHGMHRLNKVLRHIQRIPRLFAEVQSSILHFSKSPPVQVSKLYRLDQWSISRTVYVDIAVVLTECASLVNIQTLSVCLGPLHSVL